MTRAGTQATQQTLLACALGGHFLSWRTSCPLIVIERENKTAKRISA
jgi:hypothetical protein